MVPLRRLMDAASHAHRRVDDDSGAARLHHRVFDPAAPRVEWHTPPQKEKAMHPGMEDVPRTECPDSCAFGAFIGALAGCLIGALIMLAVLMLWGGR